MCERRDYFACHYCDALIKKPRLDADTLGVYCYRCQSKQFTYHPAALNKMIAFSLCAFAFLFVSLIFPFLSFESQGLTRSIFVHQASSELFNQDFILLSLLVNVFMLAFPVVLLIAILAVSIPRKFKIMYHWQRFFAVVISYARPWVMTEVFFIGVLVALIKVSDLANVHFETAFWAYSGFVIFFLMAVNSAHPYQIWSWLKANDNRLNL